MKRCSILLVVALLIVAVFFISGCGLQHKVKHVQAALFGLKRKIEVNRPDGTKRTWEGHFNVKIKGSWARFIADGKTVYVSESGAVIIEEL